MRQTKIVILFFMIPFISGCDLFSTRTPEQPVQPRSNYKAAVTPDILLENLINSLAEKNIQNYLNCLTDSAFSGKSFQFIPSAGSSSLYPALFDLWNRKSEEQYFTNLVSHITQDLPMTLTLNNDNLSYSGDRTIGYTASYFLTVPHNDEFTKNFEGELQFTMVRDSREVWTIATWRDIKSSQTASWSELKGFYYPN